MSLYDQGVLSNNISYVCPSTFIFIRDTRYTYQFLQQHESFTLSFFNEKYRNVLRICGTMSGRNMDLAEPYKSKIIEEAYKNEPSKHQMFISEIVNIWIKK